MHALAQLGIFHFLGARIWLPMPLQISTNQQINFKFTFTIYEYILLSNFI